MSSSDIEQLLLRMDGCSTTSKKGLLKKDFQLLSEIIVEKMKTGIKKGRKRNINESDNKTALINTDNIYDIVDTQDGSYEDEIDKSIEDSHGNVLSHEYKPKEKVYNEANIDKSTYRRDSTVGLLALKLANYECQLNKDHKTFISNTTSKNYVEAHHLIPMKYYYSSEFKKSIDNEANIVVLCPVCHRRLHYGKFEDKKKLLKYLYDEYNDKLNKVKIGIKWDRLLEMYIECSANTNEVN